MEYLESGRSCSKNLQCINCMSDLTESYVDSYALPLTGKIITVYEGLETVFKGYETSSSTFNSIVKDQTRFCNPCGNVFGELLRLYTQFLELSTLNSVIHSLVNEFPHQFVSEPGCMAMAEDPPINTVDSQQHNPVSSSNSDAEFFSELDDIKMEVDDFPDTTEVENEGLRRSGRVKKPIILDTSSLMGPEVAGDEDFIHTNISSEDDQQETDSDFNETISNDEAEKPKRRFCKDPLTRYKCDVCGEFFQIKYLLRMHKESVHEGIRNFRCSICGNSFRDKRRLSNHENAMHKIKRRKFRPHTPEEEAALLYKEYKCDTEGCETVSLSTFKEWLLHQQDIHKIDTGYKDIEKKNTLEPRAMKIRPCPHCGKKLIGKLSVVRHVMIYHLNLQHFECDVCQKKFVSQTLMNIHKEKVHTESSYLCNLCGAILKSQTSLDRHEETHYGRKEKSFPCDQCDKSFPKPSSLKGHKEVAHSDLEPYECDQCEKKFKARRLLNNHVRRMHIYTVTIPNPCEFCEKRFPLKKQLKAHLMVHHKLSNQEANTSAKIVKKDIFRILPNGERVYPAQGNPEKCKTCQYCGKSYSRLEFVFTHLVKVHGKTAEEAKDITKFETKRKFIANTINGLSPASLKKRKPKVKRTKETVQLQLPAVTEEVHQNFDQQLQDKYEDNFPLETILGC